jgi:hypothetical protein
MLRGTAVGRRLTVSAVALVGALLAAEAGVRVAAHVLPGVRYLATAGIAADRPSYATLQEFLTAHSEHLIPHRPWFNYWNNSLGFNDREFEVPKPAGRLRIMALGDSFAYGLVPYPDNVLTIVEERLRARCGCDLDLLNFGIGATEVRDYKDLLDVSHAMYDPDLIAVHFYMGNDGPDLHETQIGDRWLRPLAKSYAGNYVRNAWRLRAVRFVNSARVGNQPDPRAARSTPSRGGAVIDPQQPTLTDRDPVMAGPTLTEDAFFLEVAKSELFRLYAPATRTARAEQSWAPTLALLDDLRKAIGRGSRIVVVLFPSAVQVYPRLRAEVVNRLHQRGRFTDVTLQDIDATLPNRMLAGYCRRVNVPCIDLTPAFLGASRRSTEPLYRANETHWNIRGNHVAAEAEATALGNLLCQEPRSRC